VSQWRIDVSDYHNIIHKKQPRVAYSYSYVGKLKTVMMIESVLVCLVHGKVHVLSCYARTWSYICTSLNNMSFFFCREEAWHGELKKCFSLALLYSLSLSSFNFIYYVLDCSYEQKRLSWQMSLDRLVVGWMLRFSTVCAHKHKHFKFLFTFFIPLPVHSPSPTFYIPFPSVLFLGEPTIDYCVHS